MTTNNKPTVADACALYRTLPKGNYSFPRFVDAFDQELGSVPLCELRRQQLWDHVVGHNWPTRLQALQIIKRVLNFAVRPRTNFGSRPGALPPAALIGKADNPLEGVKVNVTPTMYVGLKEKRERELAELEVQMTLGSEPAWKHAHLMQRLVAETQSTSEK